MMLHDAGGMVQDMAQPYEKEIINTNSRHKILKHVLDSCWALQSPD